MRTQLRNLALVITAAAVVACGDNKSNPPSNGPTTTPTTPTASAAFTQTDATTGVSISAPAGAYDASAAKPTFTIAKGTTLPSGATAPTGSTLGPVYTITKDYADAFLQPVTITVPYDPAVNALPTVLHWDAANSKFQAAQVRSIDATAKTVTFSSVTFSAFTVMSGTAGPGTAADSGFTPLVDGFQINNFGNYQDPGKSSVAMSAIASWFYTNNKAAGNLYDLSKNNAATASAVVNVVQKAAAPIWHTQWHLTNYTLTPDQTGRLLIQALALTKQPQLFIMKSVVASTDTNAVEVVVYKYAPDCTTATPPVCSTTRGKFYIYNPDFPGEETTIDWVSGTGAGSGFANYSKAPAYSSAFTAFAFDALPSLGSNGQFNTGWQGVNTSAVQNAIVLSSPTPIDASGTYSQTLTGTALPDVQVTGTVGGGASVMTFTVNGGPLQAVALSSGTFNFTLKGTDLKNVNSVVFTAGTIRNPYNVSGFKALILKFQGSSIATFTNFGFETGDKTGWTTETHLWNSNVDVAPTSPDAVQRNFVGCPFTKATASGSGFDSCTYAPTATTSLPACTATSKVGDLCYNEAWGTVIKFTPATFTPEKSAIVGKTTVFANPEGWFLGTGATFTAGIDPVVDFYQKNNGDKTILGQAANLPVNFNGSWALRVNNEDNNNHASTAKQQTTIPNVAAPEIKFAWAAVLEDPGHENSAQPFVDVSVIDNDTGFVLYRKFFYSGNPEYSGWVKLNSPSPTGTRWNVIPWQTVSITGAGLANAVGHKVTIQVYASDCLFSGHGGYAYIDDAP